MTPSPLRAGRDVNDQIMGSTDLVETLSPAPTYLPSLSQHQTSGLLMLCREDSSPGVWDCREQCDRY